MEIQAIYKSSFQRVKIKRAPNVFNSPRNESFDFNKNLSQFMDSLKITFNPSFFKDIIFRVVSTSIGLLVGLYIIRRVRKVD
jgi:hypothetical protein